LDEMRNLDMFNQETKEELRKLDNIKCIEYILDYNYSEYEARILQPKFERIKTIDYELKKLKFEYAHSGENGGFRVSEDDRMKFKNSRSFARFRNDENMNIFLDENPNYLDMPELEGDNLFNEWMLEKFIQERIMKYNNKN